MPRLLAALLTVAAAAALVLLPADQASAAPPPTVSPSTVQRGGSLTVSGTGCWDPEYDPYGGTGRTAWWVNVQTTPMGGSWTHALGSVQTDEWDGGAWSVTLRLPDMAGPGSYSVYARCSLGSAEFDYPAVPFTVVGDPIPPNWWEPGGGGPPGQPKGPGAAPPAPAPPPATRPTAPQSAAAHPSSGTPATTTSPGTTSSPGNTSHSPAATPAPAPGCSDCARLASGDAVRAGRSFVLRYAGFLPGERVTVVMHSTPVQLGAFTADDDGVVTAPVTIPASAAGGEHTLTLTGETSGEQALPFTVAEPPPSRAVDREAGAGGVVLPATLLGAALVLGAAGALVVRRRRSTGRPDRPAQATETPIREPIA
ncbi:UNVERIFIED_ORG: hypothetical protein E4P37_14725 [Bacillus sp. AZ43]